MEQRDLIIIGGGVGGLVTASVAAQLGLSVTLIEKSGKLGGDCLHYGCVPSKSLIQAARVAETVRRAGRFGIEATLKVPAELGRVNRHIREVIETIQQHDDPERFRAYGCEVLFGTARFTAKDRIVVDGRTLQAKRFVIATGSSPAVPDLPGLKEAGYQTNETVFAMPSLPQRLAVVGGGPIGVELAQSYARLGSQVTLIQRNNTILPREEPAASRLLQQRLSGEGLDIVTGVQIERVDSANGTRTLHCKANNGVRLVEVDEILIAAGRQPNTGGLELERAGVEYDRHGIRVDRRLRSSNRRIFACGDVAGPYLFTHMAEYQAGIVLSNIVFRLPRRVDYSVVPWVTYTEPELARVGVTEAEARMQGMRYDVLQFDFADIDRALAERSTDGFIRLIVKQGSRWRGGGRILGATIIGPQAGELLHEIVLAMKLGARIGDIAATVHAYPTLAQIHRRAVNRHYGRKLFSPATRRLAGWLNRLLP